MIDAHRVTLASEDDLEGWRDAARDLAEAGVPPEAVWLTGEESGAGFHSSDTLATSNVLRITSVRP